VCQTAGAAVKRLAGEYSGQRVVFLEYYAGVMDFSRESRFVAAFGGWGFSVPEAIVGSGYRYSQGPADYYKVFKGMIESDQARAPEAEIKAWWRKADATTLRLYAQVRNSSGLVLDPAANEAAVWGLAWESNPALGVTGMYTRAAVRVPVPRAVRPGESAMVVADLPINPFVNWTSLHAAVAAEIRPAGASGPYDMLQAVLPQPAGFSVEPGQVRLAVPQGPGASELRFAGPRTLSWAATTNVAWLRVTPEEGTVDTVARIEALRPGLQPGQQVGAVTFTASSSDGMSFAATVSVTTAFDPDWRRAPNLPRRRLSRSTPTVSLR